MNYLYFSFIVLLSINICFSRSAETGEEWETVTTANRKSSSSSAIVQRCATDIVSQGKTVCELNLASSITNTACNRCCTIALRSGGSCNTNKVCACNDR
ncbi:CLUMA_CG003104, isoform A [Clunio marinus]|uniref:CLUMA_CG003104, isoform A n=1 Tax=Clunio marinus TaxID=568069 RepID=A0A1J1HT25_9DIPT|nr:CLUMA_CG003104, isoform A [Clunio marinus]